MAVVFSNVTGDISPNFIQCFENNFVKQKLDSICKDCEMKPVSVSEVFADEGETLRVHGNLETILHIHQKLIELLIVHGDFTKQTIFSANNENDKIVRNLRQSQKHSRSLSQIIDNITEQKLKPIEPDCGSNTDLQRPMLNEITNDKEANDIQPAKDILSTLPSKPQPRTGPEQTMQESEENNIKKTKRLRKQTRPYNLRKSINQSSKLTFLKLKKPEADMKPAALYQTRSTSNNCKTIANSKRTVVTRHRDKSKCLSCDFCDFKCEETSQLNEHCAETHNDKSKKKDSLVKMKVPTTRSLKAPDLINITPKENSPKDSKVDNFCCEKCDFKTNSPSNLKQHLQRIHIGVANKNYPCGICGKIFGYSKGLKRHLKSHERKMEKLRNMPTEFNCEYCKYSSKKSLHLKEHMRRKHMDVTNQVFQCDECGKSFGYVKGLKRHQKTHEVRRQLILARQNEPLNLDCAHCKYTAKKKIHLFEHMRRNHMDITNKSFPCPKCGKLYGFRKDLNRHMKIHEDPSIVCEECGNLYKSMTALKYHMKTHDENNVHTRYHCKKCPRSFKQRGTLNLHFKNIHLGIRDCFLCQTCDKSFCRKASYIAHMNVHLGKKPHVCEICGKAFSYVKSIIEHRRTHSEVRAFQCDICLKTFRLSSALYKHKQIHAEGKHACAICRKTFRDKSSLSLHERIHSGIKPFSCKLCIKSFSDRSHAQKHMVSIHEINPEHWKKYIKSELMRPTKRFIERVNSDAMNDVYFSIAHPKKVRLSGLPEPLPVLPVNSEMSSDNTGNTVITSSSNSNDCSKLPPEVSEVTEEIYTVPDIPSPETAIECGLSEETSDSIKNESNSTDSVLQRTCSEPNFSKVEQTSHTEDAMQCSKQKCVVEEVSLATVASITETLVPTSPSVNMTDNIIYLSQKAEPLASSNYTETQTTTSTYIIKDLDSSVQVANYSTPELVEESVIATNLIQDSQGTSFVNVGESVDNEHENGSVVESEQLIYATENGEQFSQIIIVEEVDGQVIYTMSR